MRLFVTNPTTELSMPFVIIVMENNSFMLSNQNTCLVNFEMDFSTPSLLYIWNHTLIQCKEVKLLNNLSLKKY